MSIKSDKWIREMSLKEKMISPFIDNQIRNKFWERPFEDEWDVDIETMALQMAQLLKWKKLVKEDMKYSVDDVLKILDTIDDADALKDLNAYILKSIE